jgi:hypothetical protein
MLIPNKLYDALKLIALLVLPFSELISALASIWGWSYGPPIVATLVAVDTFLGCFVKICADAYKNCSGEPEDDQ